MTTYYPQTPEEEQWLQIHEEERMANEQNSEAGGAGAAGAARLDDALSLCTACQQQRWSHQRIDGSRLCNDCAYAGAARLDSKDERIACVATIRSTLADAYDRLEGHGFEDERACLRGAMRECDTLDKLLIETIAMERAAGATVAPLEQQDFDDIVDALDISTLGHDRYVELFHKLQKLRAARAGDPAGRSMRTPTHNDEQKGDQARVDTTDG